MDYEHGWNDLKQILKDVYKCRRDIPEDGPYPDNSSLDYHCGYTIATKHALQCMEQHEREGGHVIPRGYPTHYPEPDLS